MEKKNIKTIILSFVISVFVFTTGTILVNWFANSEPITVVNLNDDHTIITGVIRNTGDDWELIQDDGHQAVGITNVSQNNEFITVSYAVMDKVNSIAVTVDEAMASENYVVGASVGLSETHIYIYDKEGNSVSPADYTNELGNIWVQGVFKK